MVYWFFKRFLFFHVQSCQTSGMLMNARNASMRKKKITISSDLFLGKDEKKLWCRVCFQSRTRNQDSAFPLNSRYEIKLRKGGNNNSHNISHAKPTVIRRGAKCQLHLLLLKQPQSCNPHHYLSNLLL